MHRYRLPPILGAVLIACGVPQETDRSRSSETLFATADNLGIDFVHADGATGSYYVPEMMGGGVAMFDFDRDEDLDVFFVQGGKFGEAVDWTDRLFRNELQSDPATLVFTNVENATPPPSGYGMGAATGDYNQDGWPDLYVTRFGSNQLLHNNGDGTFSDVTATAEVDDSRWSIAATFFDFDRDGLHDLFVGNFLDFRLDRHVPCQAPAGWPDYCGPLAYRSVPDRLFRNLGNGQFEDVSASSGIGSLATNTLGVAARDFDNDGWIDLYVANDSQPNTLWINNRDGTFTDRALVAGCAVNQEGKPEASMGVALGDYDADGDEDIFLAHLDGESNTLYEMSEGGLCVDATATAGLGVPSLAATAFGTAFVDADMDGWLDLVAANGAISVLSDQLQAGRRMPLAQQDHFFRNLQGERFEEDREAIPDFATARTSRGLAVGDLDNDGRPDLIVTHVGGTPLVLRNVAVGRDWLGLDVRDENGGVAYGARVMVDSGTRKQLLTVASDGSYASASDPRRLLAQQQGSEIQSVEVRWPSGATRRWENLSFGSYHRLAPESATPDQGSDSD